MFQFVLLLGFSVTMFNGHGHVYAQEFTDCYRHTFSLVDCPKTLPNDDDGEKGNIEEQIPSVVPFP